MSDEEMNKKMEFIVEQQAKFAADIDMIREVQSSDARRFRDALLGLVDIVGSLARSQLRTDETVNSLTQAQARTEESLRMLVNVVERHIGGNGNAQSPA